MPEHFEEENQNFDYQEDNFGLNQVKTLSKGQKIGVIFLAFFAVFAVVAWSIQFKNSISSPFANQSAGTDDTGGQDKACYGQECDAEYQASLKNTDTDQDGLNDWDELNVYKTSPYLEDSDSDGFLDKEEIDNDKDPNCPIGSDCYSSGLVDSGKKTSEGNVSTNDSSLNNLLNQFGSSETGQSGQAGEPALGASDIEAILGGDLDAASLRQLLLQYGMDKKMLDQISDENLMESFQDVLGE